MLGFTHRTTYFNTFILFVSTTFDWEKISSIASVILLIELKLYSWAFILKLGYIGLLIFRANASMLI